MRDIEHKDDIVLLINTFYDKVKKDDIIGHIFHRIIGDDWSQHLPIMYQFWETVLLHKAGYTGNPIQKHVAIDKITELKPIHYQQWLSLWEQTIDELYTGKIADEAKKKAHTMMQLIDMKVTAARTGKSIL